MEERTYLCQECRNVFRLPVTGSSLPEKESRCPSCGSNNISEVSSWTPIGSDFHEGVAVWEYECQNCKHVFKLPVPSSPSQEKEIKCPVCEGGHIHRLTPAGGIPLYCG